jgi:drug/metabolite transporter (DMT)-like permease
MEAASVQDRAQKTVMFQIIFIAATWGTAFTFIKVTTQAGMLPFSIAAARGGLTAIVFALWLVFTDKKFSTDRFTLRHMIVLGFLNGLVPNVLIATAMQQIESAPAAMIQASIPVIVAVMGNFILSQDKLRLRQWLGILIGLAGVFVVIDPRAVITGHATAVGSIAMLGAALSYATSTIYLRASKPDDPYSTALGQQIVSTAAAIVLMAVWEPQHIWHQSVSVWLALLGLAIVSTAIPTILYFKLVSQVAASKAALVQYLLPIAAGLYAVVLLGESLRPGVIGGGLIVLLGVWLTTRPATPIV